MTRRKLVSVLALVVGTSTALDAVDAQRRPVSQWRLQPVPTVSVAVVAPMPHDSLRPLEIPQSRLTVDPPNRRLRRFLLTGLVVGAAAGGVALVDRTRNRCEDCWFAPAIEIPLFVGGGALVGYGSGALLYAVTRTERSPK